MIAKVPPAQLAAYNQQWLDALEPAELAALLTDPGFWLRTSQTPPRDAWRWAMWIGGRGAGKTLGAAYCVQREVELGRARNIALVAQDEVRAQLVQVEGLQEIAPPWCRPEMYLDQLVWPNGATATIYTPNSPRSIRGPSFDLSWGTELNFWPAATGLAAFNTLVTATRAGRARMVLDTSPSGDSEIVQMMLALNKADPTTYYMSHGSMLENAGLDKAYIQLESTRHGGPGTQAYEEEVNGVVYGSTAGAAYTRDELEACRVYELPAAHAVELRIMSVDPSQTTDPRSDETGIVEFVRSIDGQIHAVADHSGTLSAESICETLLDAHEERQASMVLWEMNAGGMWLQSTLKAIAVQRGIVVEELDASDKVPRYQRGKLYTLGITARVGKMKRALPASTVVRQKRAHVVGHLSKLEKQLREYTGRGDSPGRFDAFNQGVCQLAGLHGEMLPTASQRQTRMAVESEMHRHLQQVAVARVRSRSVL